MVTRRRGERRRARRNRRALLDALSVELIALVVEGSSKSNVVGVLRNYCNSNSATRQINELIKKARAEQVERPLRLPRKPRQPKTLPSAVQQAIANGYTAGKTMHDLAREFGVHRTTIKATLERHGIPRRRRTMTPDHVDESVRRYESGESLARIGDQLNFDAQTIANQLRKRGVRIRTPHERP